MELDCEGVRPDCVPIDITSDDLVQTDRYGCQADVYSAPISIAAASQPSGGGGGGGGGCFLSTIGFGHAQWVQTQNLRSHFDGDISFFNAKSIDSYTEINPNPIPD
jgi:hypothetical protein